MVHFRIADGLLDDLINIDVEKFIVGNICPDCGEPNSDWSAYNPPNNVTHWFKDDYMQNKKEPIDFDKFINTYISTTINSKKLSLYIGYYIHLLTDTLWSDEIYLPSKNKYLTEFANDNNFIWKLKGDWYDLDHLFLKEHTDFRAFNIFNKISIFKNIYFEYYSETAIERQIKFICDFYNNFNDTDNRLSRDYIYLTKEEMNYFVAYSIEKIKTILINNVSFMKHFVK